MFPNGMMSSGLMHRKFEKRTLRPQVKPMADANIEPKKEKKLNMKVFESTFNSRNENHACAQVIV